MIDSDQVWMHVKTGREYFVLTHATLEASGEAMVVYYARGLDGKVWIRPHAEFYDGRFKKKGLE